MGLSTFIGTSGWHYDHWVGPFYPEGSASDEMLPFYAQRLKTVEVNNTFYQLPGKETVETWRDRTPSEFTFALKASRYITHMKKLKEPEESVANFLELADVLGDKRGPILFQLPPNWHYDHERLASFLRLLPDGYQPVFEFRHDSWFNDRAYELLEQHGAAVCIHDMGGDSTPRVVTAGHVYIRLHGPRGDYSGGYDAQTLSGWAGAITTWSNQGKIVYCYFNNDVEGHAVQNAQQLAEMLD